MKQALRGIPREELTRIWDDVQANHKRLDGCTGPHDFQPIAEPGTKLARRYRCPKCAGTVDASQAHWYARGLEHARR